MNNNRQRSVTDDSRLSKITYGRRAGLRPVEEYVDSTPNNTPRNYMDDDIFLSHAAATLSSSSIENDKHYGRSQFFSTANPLIPKSVSSMDHEDLSIINARLVVDEKLVKKYLPYQCSSFWKESDYSSSRLAYDKTRYEYDNNNYYYYVESNKKTRGLRKNYTLADLNLTDEKEHQVNDRRGESSKPILGSFTTISVYESRRRERVRKDKLIEEEAKALRRKYDTVRCYCDKKCEPARRGGHCLTKDHIDKFNRGKICPSCIEKP